MTRSDIDDSGPMGGRIGRAPKCRIRAHPNSYIPWDSVASVDSAATLFDAGHSNEPDAVKQSDASQGSTSLPPMRIPPDSFRLQHRLRR